MTLVTQVQGPTPWRKIRSVVGASATVTVDTIPLTLFRSANYFVELQNVTNSRYKSFELNALYDNTTIRDTISGKQVSGIMSIEVSMKIDGSNAVLEIINNETFDLDVEVIRGVLK